MAKMENGVCNDKKDDSMASMSSLPDLVLDKVFSFLPISDKVSVEYVCKRWHEPSRRSWVHVNEFNTNCISVGRLIGKDFTPILAFFTLLNRMRRPKTGVTSLTTLTMDEEFLSSVDLALAFRKICKLCPNVTNLQIKLRKLGKNDFSAAHIRILFELEKDVPLFRGCCGQQLKRLSIQHGYYVTRKDLKEIFRLCPKLEELALYGNYRLVNVPLPSAQGNQTNRGLKKLIVSNCVLVDDSFFDKLLKSSSFATLKVLSLAFCGDVTSDGMMKLSQIFAHGQLEYLGLRTTWTDVNLDLFFNHGDNTLRHLDLSFNPWLTDRVVSSILLRLPFLDRITLNLCGRVSNSLPKRWFADERVGVRWPVLIKTREKHAPLTLDVFLTRIVEQRLQQDLAWTFDFEDHIDHFCHYPTS